MTLRNSLLAATIVGIALLGGPMSFAPNAAAADGTPSKFMEIDPPQNFSSDVRKMGFADIGQVELSSLDMTVFRLTVPTGQTIDSAVEKIERAFPEAIVEPDAETFSIN
ncbi:MAG: hypothetical protein O3A84_11745 [Proteobacteria bacterium]|nr:hypothetical protein [Pseudomonadota bacterium]